MLKKMKQKNHKKEPRATSSRFSINSEANASEFIENKNMVSGTTRIVMS